MAVSQCGKCGLLISISNIPGGNPAVQMAPERWTTGVNQCPACKLVLCDKCAEQGKGLLSLFLKPKCGKCGAKLIKHH